MHGFWAAMWEIIAWDELQQEAHGRSRKTALQQFAGSFTDQMLFEAIDRENDVTDCDRVPPSMTWRPPSGISEIRWTRGGVRW